MLRFLMASLIPATSRAVPAVRRSAGRIAGTMVLLTWAGASAGDPAVPGRGAMLVFISLSMPDASLRRLADEAGRAGAVLVLRGLRNDRFRDTLERLRRLYGKADAETGPSALIDPAAFQRFRVAAVPVYALLLEAPMRCTTDSCPAPRHLRLAGDVSLRIALERFREHPAGAAHARPMLESLVAMPERPSPLWP